MESRGDCEDYCEEESRFLTDPRCSVSSGIEKRKMNVSEIEETVSRVHAREFELVKTGVCRIENEGGSTHMVKSSTASSGVTIPLLRTAGVVPLVLISSPSPAGNPFSSFL